MHRRYLFTEKQQQGWGQGRCPMLPTLSMRLISWCLQVVVIQQVSFKMQCKYQKFGKIKSCMRALPTAVQVVEVCPWRWAVGGSRNHCADIKDSKQLRDFKPQNLYDIKAFTNCYTTFVKHILTCNCGCFHIGWIKRQLKDRVSEHKNVMSLKMTCFFQRPCFFFTYIAAIRTGRPRHYQRNDSWWWLTEVTVPEKNFF